MPGGIESGMSDRDALAAVLFLSAINETMQAYGTLNSSPWTAARASRSDMPDSIPPGIQSP